jgi:septum formation protein
MSKANDSTDVILASKSPRRKELLNQAGITCRVIPSRVDENQTAPMAPVDYVRTLAEAKAAEISDANPECWVIGADTIVLIDHTILGKPASADDARSMLQRLSGRMHQVLTGYCIRHTLKQLSFCDTVTTDVYFKPLAQREIDWYIRTGEPFDKAGAYAIQGVGAFLVKRINGSYTNVVGLPVCEVMEIFIREGIAELDIDSPIPT